MSTHYHSQYWAHALTSKYAVRAKRLQRHEVFWMLRYAWTVLGMLYWWVGLSRQAA